jgi:hypothetical protein
MSINGIDLSLENFAGGQPFPYRASFRYPGLKTVTLEGTLSYREEQATLGLKNNRLKIQDLTLPIEGSVTQVATAPLLNLTVAADAVDANWCGNPLGFRPGAARHRRCWTHGPTASNSPGIQQSGRRDAGVIQEHQSRGKRALKGNLSGEIFLQTPLGGGSMTRRLRGDGKWPFATAHGLMSN